MSILTTKDLYTVISVCTIALFYAAIALMIAAYIIRERMPKRSGKLKKASVCMIFIGIALFLIWGIARAIYTGPYS